MVRPELISRSCGVNRLCGKMQITWITPYEIRHYSVLRQGIVEKGGSMQRNRPIQIKIYARAVVAIILIISWSLLASTGLLLWLAPSGVRAAGQIQLLLGLTKHEWGDIHFWIAVATIVVTVVHVIIDWKALLGVIRYLISVHRSTEVISK